MIEGEPNQDSIRYEEHKHNLRALYFQPYPKNVMGFQAGDILLRRDGDNLYPVIVELNGRGEPCITIDKNVIAINCLKQSDSIYYLNEGEFIKGFSLKSRNIGMVGPIITPLVTVFRSLLGAVNEKYEEYIFERELKEILSKGFKRIVFSDSLDYRSENLEKFDLLKELFAKKKLHKYDSKPEDYERNLNDTLYLLEFGLTDFKNHGLDVRKIEEIMHKYIDPKAFPKNSIRISLYKCTDSNGEDIPIKGSTIVVFNISLWTPF